MKRHQTILKQIQYKFSSRNQVNGQQYDDSVPAEELNAVLRALLQRENMKYEMHRNSIMNDLDNLLESTRDSEYNEYDQYDEDEKRSIATLAKNGQLPTVGSPDIDESLSEDDNGHKRNLASMARSGMIGGKRNVQSLARQMNFGGGKRNIGSLMRNNMFPDSGKRNLGSLVRNGYGKRNIGYMKNAYGKRNVGTLARDWALPKFTGSKYMDGKLFLLATSFNYTPITQLSSSLDGKRNIQSLKNQVNGRKKRDVGEALEPVYQTGPLDYEELLQSLSDNYLQNPAEKRYLGELS